ncbi:MAG: glycosyltransferase family 2 protein [Muribaculum sp.]|nr:glycosyltransferase family 2 protein [Muribaculum sp.]
MAFQTSSESYSHRFSVFTATYNRGKKLLNLYNDLLNQTYKDFEWVVVNDGSNDDTTAIMQDILAQNKLDINYVVLPKNGGKHMAWREGLKHFKGRYVISADDDDPFLPDALSIHNKYWTELEKQSDYDEFWEVRTRCVDSKGNLIGKPLPKPYLDSDYIKVNVIMKNKAEMVGSRKIEILRNEASVPTFLFEDKSSNFPEIIRWIRAARKYNTRFVPDITRIFEPNPCGLTNRDKSKRSLYNGFIGGGICCWKTEIY